MIILDATTKTLEVKLAGAVTTNQLDVTCHAVDTLNADQSVSATVNKNTPTNGGTAITAMAAPAANHTRIVKSLTVYNKDTVQQTVTVQINDNGTLFIQVSIPLDPKDTLQYTSED